MRKITGFSIAMISVLAMMPTSVAAASCAPATVVGTSGDDKHLEGTPGNDVIDALGGVDLVDAFGGNDRVCLGPGGTSAPFEGEVARGGGGDDRLFGGPGRDYLSPGPGNDRANGDAGQDYLVGSDGEDTMLGGKGNDDVFGGRGNDVVRGGPGVDRVNGGQGTDACFGTRSDRFIDCETINGAPA